MAKLEFYCCDCDLIFESEPDGTGYDQAACPKCEQVSMTSEFEGKSTKEVEKKSRFIVVAEFLDEAAAVPVTQKLEEAGLPVQINLPDVTEGDFFMGGSDNVCVMVPSDLAERARELIEQVTDDDDDSEE